MPSLASSSRISGSLRESGFVVIHKEIEVEPASCARCAASITAGGGQQRAVCRDADLRKLRAVRQQARQNPGKVRVQERLAADDLHAADPVIEREGQREMAQQVLLRRVVRVRQKGHGRQTFAQRSVQRVVMKNSRIFAVVIRFLLCPFRRARRVRGRPAARRASSSRPARRAYTSASMSDSARRSLSPR